MLNVITWIVVLVALVSSVFVLISVLRNRRG